MKKRVGIFIGDKFHVRSLVESGTLDLLLEKYQVTVFTTSILKSNFLKYERQLDLVEINVNKKVLKLFRLHLKLGTARFYRKSKSFKFRIRRYVLGDYYPEKDIIAQLYWIIKTTLKALDVLIRFLVGKSVFYLMIQKNYLESVESILKPRTINKDDFDILLSWCSTSEPSALAPIVFGAKVSIPSMVVVDNWDNLCSKSIFPVEPNSLVCFGNQSARFARTIHDFLQTRIFPIGSARFEVYRDYICGREKLEGIDYLYAGSAIAIEDEEVLQFLQDYSLSRNLNKKFRYRRHPFPQGPKIHLEDLKKKYSTIEIEEINTLESLNQTKESLLSCKTLIAMPTTFFLEGIVCGIPTILLSLESRKIRTDSRAMINNLEHLFGIEELQGLEVARDFTQLSSLLDSTIEERGNNSRELVSEFVNWPNDNFGKKLELAINETIELNQN
jgi:hypothetical protein